MLGTALTEELSETNHLWGLDIVKPKRAFSNLKLYIECNITNQSHLKRAVAKVAPQVVIHTAAYTDVDGCEAHPEAARRINVQGSENVALASRAVEATLFYISTDFVFDGENVNPYKETDKTHPLNVYGKTKLDGEEHIQRVSDRFIIVRSIWLFGKEGKKALQG